VQVGRRLLRHYIFVHLAADADKFLLLLEMLHKLYALVNLLCCEDNPDAMTHHEILLPGQLLAKYFKEKVEEALGDLAEQARFRLLVCGPCSCSGCS
jgi:DNA-directed RNA polymerase I subunit RPA2